MQLISQNKKGKLAERDEEKRKGGKKGFLGRSLLEEMVPVWFEMVGNLRWWEICVGGEGCR